MTAKKPTDRKILVRCDFATEVYRLLVLLTEAARNGRWAGQSYLALGRCFEYKLELHKKPISNNVMGEEYLLAIIVKSEPTLEQLEEDTKKFLRLPEYRVCDFILELVALTVDNEIEDYGYEDECVFESKFSQNEVTMLYDCIKNWEVVPPSPPEMTHKELVALIGHDFKYVAEKE